MYPGIYKHFDTFNSIWSSDLRRASVYADIATGFEGDGFVKVDRRLREIHFGDDDGRSYDLMTDQEKAIIDDIGYQAPNGESWKQVSDRAIEFMGEQPPNSSHIVFTHGGLICSLTYDLGLEDIITCGSCVGVVTDQEGVLEDVVFEWEFPLEDLV